MTEKSAIGSYGNARHVVWFVVVAVVAMGCDMRGRLATYPVTIVVSYADGAPVAGGHVTLRCVDHGISASGSLDAEGKCKISTYESNDGAVAGKHQAAVVPARPPGDPDKTPNRPTIDPKYLSSDTSGLEIEVLPEGPQEFQLQVARPR